MEKYLINPNHKVSKINKDIYGHFSEHLGRCVYEGIYVGENSHMPNVNGMRKDVVDALKEMGLPVLRWPGGCFADEYHWKDGIGPKETRKKMINTHWGGVVEDNSFGTGEYFELCRQLGCDAYINGNLGSGTVKEMSEWVEYMTFDGESPESLKRKENGRQEPWEVKYFGIGNENWGCGGNMSPEYYAHEFERYNTFLKDYNEKKHIYRIASGPNAEDYEWTYELMKTAKHMDGLALHYYTTPNEGGKAHATGFNEDKYYETIVKAYKMEEIITRHLEIMNSLDPKKRVDLIVDEWGTWYLVEEGTNPGFLYQQNTMRDALVAGLTLNIFNKHSDRIKMANIAQTVNVLQSVILTDGEESLLTPTYHVFKMYKSHQDNTLLGSFITSDAFRFKEESAPYITESASMDEDGVIYSTLTNASLTECAEIKCQIADSSIKNVKAEILTDKMDAHNTFGDKDRVAAKDFSEFTKTSDGFITKLPPCSIAKFTISK